MTGQETKTCQSCSTEFQITAEDTAFYKQMKVPAPTFCPECRTQRRMAWRNERSLHKRTCDMCKKSVISIYPQKTPFPVYCRECWYSDKWEPMEFEREYDFNKPFFTQYKELQDKVPRLAVWNSRCLNSDYTNQSYNNKNVYLSFGLKDCEDSAYVNYAVEAKDAFDSAFINNSESLYSCINTEKSYRSKFLQECEACVDSTFLYNCRNCQNCFGGVNLRGAEHVFFGEKLSKEEYEKKLGELNLGSHKTQQELKQKFEDLKKKTIFRYAKLVNCTNSTGDHLINAKNCENIFDGFELDNARHSAWVFRNKEIMDIYGVGDSEFIYECISIEEVQNIKFGIVGRTAHHAEFIDLCFSSSNLFACIGLRNKEYCILNKEYKKEEYKTLIEKIKNQMNDVTYKDAKGREYKYGEFFPAEISPFAYNNSLAIEHFPLSKEHVEKEGYKWQEEEERNYKTTRDPQDLPDNIKDLSDSITEEIIGCEHKGECNEGCATAFKITPQEFQFYKKMKIPIPHLCPNCRHYGRLAQRNPLNLWHSACMCAGEKSEKDIYKNETAHSHHGTKHCPNEFKTSFAPEKEEIIYCKECYDAEVA